MSNGQPHRAIVTGGGQGVGLAVTTALLQDGSQVVACDLDLHHLDDLAENYPDTLRVHGRDLTGLGACEDVIADAVDAFGGVDLLVNNAAVIGEATPFVDVDDDTWRSSIEINLMVAVRCTRAVVTRLVEQGTGGNIVTIGSDAGELPAPEFGPYSVTKAALISLSKLVSRAYGAHGVRANLISLGLTRTHATRDLIASLTEEHGSEEEGIRTFTEGLGMALGRIGEPSEVADLVRFLASDSGRQVTGAMVRMDGGTAPTI